VWEVCKANSLGKIFVKMLTHLQKCCDTLVLAHEAREEVEDRFVQRIQAERVEYERSDVSEVRHQTQEQ